MMKSTLNYLLFFLSLSSFAQNANSIWCFGDSAGIDFRNINNPMPFSSGMDTRGSCVSVADSAGNLLFYADARASMGGNTTLVYNSTHQVMQNGDSIIGEGWYNELGAIPVPGSSHEYYLFSTSIVGLSQPGLFYSIIDMSLNNGLGEVTQKNLQILSDNMADAMQLVRHGNGKDWWLITKLYDTSLPQYNRFFIHYISQAGISSPLIQDFNNSTDGAFQKLIFNNKHDKLMQINFIGFMCKYDFDRCTGVLSNPNIIFTEQTSNYSRYFWEGTFSPNDSLFYVTVLWNNFTVSDTSRLLQYDMYATNISASCDTLFIIKHPNVLGAVRLAPDNKIYMTNWYEWGFPGYPYPDSVYNQYNMNLGVINHPDSLGAACDFQPFSFYLGGKRTYAGLPNNPNYQLGRLVGSPCDTLGVGIEEQIKNNAEFFVFYHSGWQQLFINAQNIKSSNCLLQIFDMNGKEVFLSAKKTQPPYYTQDVNCIAFAKGIYVISLTTEKERLVKKFVKE